MNTAQKVCSSIAAMLFVLTLLASPWEVLPNRDKDDSIDSVAIFSPIVSPPHAVGHLVSLRANILLMWWAGIGIGYCFGFLLLKSKLTPSVINPPGDPTPPEPNKSLADRAQEKLGQALAEDTTAKVAAGDSEEHLKSVLDDLNGLLRVAALRAEVQPYRLKQPTQLRLQLQVSMEIAAQALAQAFPDRLTKWLGDEPALEHPNRPSWVLQGRRLLGKVRVEQATLREMRTVISIPTLAERAAEKLGEAVAELTSGQAVLAETKEQLKYIRDDLNDLLSLVAPGAEVFSSETLKNPTRLRAHLQASLEFLAFELAEEIPNKLTKWLDAEPAPDHPGRLQWLEKGRYILEGADTE